MEDQLGGITPQLRMVCMILDQLPIPESVRCTHAYQGKSYDITLKRIGLNPGMALGVLRNYGIAGVQHSAPTLFFWNATGAPKEVCDDYKQSVGDGIFDVIQAAMLNHDTQSNIH